MLKLTDSTHLGFDAIAPHWAEIIDCLQKYCDRYPQEETVSHMIEEIAKGNRRMWLVKDEDGKVVLVPITMIERLDHTGMTMLVLAECSGARLKEAMPLLADIEQWAKDEHHANRARFIGRKGWDRYLAPLGYREVSRIWEKEFGP